MAIDGDLNTKLRKSIIESTGTPTQPAQAVVNPDGSNVGSSSIDQSTFTASSTTGNIMQGVYQATPDTIADSKAAAIAIDTNRNVKTREQYAPGYEDNTNNVAGIAQKPVSSTTYSWTQGQAIYSDVDIAAKASAGMIRKIRVNNKNAAERFLWLINKATAPSGDTTFVQVFPIAASTNNLLTFELGDSGHYCSTGISIGVSTSATTFTAATTTDHAILYEFI